MSEKRAVTRLRERLGLTQYEMAQVLECKQETVCGFENKAPPGRRLGFKIWDLWRDELHDLRITLDDLLRPWE